MTSTRTFSNALFAKSATLVWKREMITSPENVSYGAVFTGDTAMPIIALKIIFNAESILVWIGFRNIRDITSFTSDPEVQRLKYVTTKESNFFISYTVNKLADVRSLLSRVNKFTPGMPAALWEEFQDICADKLNIHRLNSFRQFAADPSSPQHIKRTWVDFDALVKDPSKITSEYYYLGTGKTRRQTLTKTVQVQDSFPTKVMKSVTVPCMEKSTQYTSCQYDFFYENKHDPRDTPWPAGWYKYNKTIVAHPELSKNCKMVMGNQIGEPSYSWPAGYVHYETPSTKTEPVETLEYLYHDEVRTYEATEYEADYFQKPIAQPVAVAAVLSVKSTAMRLFHYESRARSESEATLTCRDQWCVLI